MSNFTFFIGFIPVLAFVLLAVNFIFAPHSPYQEKGSTFECGFHSFLGQNRTQFSISFFIFALLFLLFDLEILLVYPYVITPYVNNIYGLVIMLVFFLLLTLGFAFEIGKKALNIDSKQILMINNSIKSDLGYIPLLCPLLEICKNFISNIVTREGLDYIEPYVVIIIIIAFLFFIVSWFISLKPWINDGKEKTCYEQDSVPHRAKRRDECEHRWIPYTKKTLCDYSAAAGETPYIMNHTNNYMCARCNEIRCNVHINRTWPNCGPGHSRDPGLPAPRYSPRYVRDYPQWANGHSYKWPDNLIQPKSGYQGWQKPK